jgi:uncharacterized protein YndB with AHSA1/START domain
MHTCRAVGMEFFEEAPARFVAEVDVAATPEEIFEAFEDAEFWTQWALPITHVEWTSPPPFGVGTTRTVTMIGGVGKEVFIAWERGRRMAFRFTETSMPNTAAFAEDYQVTDLGTGRTRVRWLMAMEPTGASAVMLRVLGFVMQWGLQRMLNRFRTHVEARRARAAA